GGGALLRGLPEAAEQILSMPVRLGAPHGGLVSAAEELLTPPYATAMGLLLYPSRSEGKSRPEGQARKKPAWKRKLRAFFEDLL
ncbi:MAG: cell division protein FtsA, partial [Elusimicrobia bacterium]|nr:cell division protein FtsA [Elusimicrobiota bacterium]